MELRFSKMHGLGNDFVVFDAINQQVNLTSEQLRYIGDRHFGIGCDQILLVEKPRNTQTDFYYRIFNADGSEVEHCGNGARCFAQFVHSHGLSDKAEIPVGTAAGNITLQVMADDIVRVNMGAPAFEPTRLPFIAPQAPQYTLNIENQNIQFSAVSMGNPHAVIQVEQLDNAPVEQLGRLIETHDSFPQRVNVGFMRIKDRTQISLRVWERGAGETLACGTGACAAVVAGINLGLLDETVEVQLRGGQLVVNWAKASTPVYMSGPATHIYEGRIAL